MNPSMPAETTSDAKVDSLSTAPDIPPRTLSDTAVPQQRLDHYARHQFEQIREARRQLVQERQTLDQDLDLKRKELDRQKQQLFVRIQDLQEREQRLAEQGGVAGEAELVALKQQLQEQQYRIEILQAERDATAAQLKQLRAQQLQQLEQIEEKHNASLARHEELEQMREERGMLLSRLEELELAEHRRGEAQRQLDHLRRQITDTCDSVDLGQRDQPLDGLVETRLPLALFQQQIIDIQSERDALGGEVSDLRDRLRALEPLVQERDSLRRQLEQQSADRQDWMAYEAEFTLLRRQLIDERRQMMADFRDNQRRLRQWANELEATQQDLDQRRARLHSELRPAVGDVRGEHDLRPQLAQREADLRIREAEVAELRRIAEQELALHRDQLTKERLQLVALRETLKPERVRNACCTPSLLAREDYPESGDPSIRNPHRSEFG